MKSLIVFFLTLTFSAYSLADVEAIRFDDSQRGLISEYDFGPDPRSAVGRKYAEIFSSIPNFRTLSKTLLEGDFFKWSFGPQFYRGRLGENQVKVLILGQDTEEDSVLSQRAFTGPLGQQIQSYLNYLGYTDSYLFINLFPYQLNQPYSESKPLLINKRLHYLQTTTNNMYNFALNTKSPIVQWQNQLLTHVFESNKESMQLIITLDRVASDRLSRYINANGGHCPLIINSKQAVQGVRYKPVLLKNKIKGFVPVDQRGELLFTAHQGDEPLSSSEFMAKATDISTQKITLLQNGTLKNGLNSLSQLGYDVQNCSLGAKKSTLTHFLNLRQNIKIVHLYPSQKDIEDESVNTPSTPVMGQQLFRLMKQHLNDRSWEMRPDTDSRFLRSQSYQPNLSTIPRIDLPFGITNIVGQPQSEITFKNLSTKKHPVIEFENTGHLNKAIEFSSGPIKQEASFVKDEILNSFLTPPTAFADASDHTELYPWESNRIEIFKYDLGPGRYWAEVFTGLRADVPRVDKDLLKPLYNQPNITLAMSNVDHGALSLYRGRPDSTEVLILADQFSHDDMVTGRALTGLEGQRLQSFLHSIKAGLNYTILRTLPVDTLGAHPDDVKELVRISQPWRKSVWEKLIKNPNNKKKIKLIITLGEQAETLIKTQQLSSYGLPVIHIPRVTPLVSVSLKTGITFKPDNYQVAFNELIELGVWSKEDFSFSSVPISIPREDLPWGTRRWMGTSGNRVLRAIGKAEGQTYKLIAPEWLLKTESPHLTSNEVQSLFNE